MNQSKLEANTRDQRQPRGNACYQVAIGFGFASDWLSWWHEFLNQSQSVVKQNQSNSVISFDTQLITVLSLMWIFMGLFSRQSNPDQSEEDGDGSPSTNGNLADSSSSLEPIRSTHGSEISLPRSMLRSHFAQEPIMEEDYPPPPPPYHSGTPGQAPPHEGNFSDTSSEGNFVQPVYHRPTLHDSDPAARARRFMEAGDHGTYPNFYTAPQRSLNGTPGVGVLGFRGHADGGSELDTTSISRAMESNIDLRHSAAASRLSRASKSRGQSQELVHPVYSQSPASGIPRPRDSGLGPSRNDLRRTSLNSKRGSSQVTPVIRAVPTPQRRDSESSKERSPYHVGYGRTRSRDPRAYDSASSEYSSSRDELLSALEFGKRHNLDQYYGIPTLETTSVSSNTTNSSDQDGICKFSASPRPTGDGCFEPTPVHAPPFNPRSRSRGNENYIYVLDPRRRGVDRGAVPVTSQPKPNGSLVWQKKNQWSINTSPTSDMALTSSKFKVWFPKWKSVL